MACDSLWTAGDLKGVYKTKIHRYKSGALIGFSGSNDSRWLIEIMERVKKASDMPHPSILTSIKCDARALFVLPTGEIYVIETLAKDPGEYDDWGITPITWPYWAVGSGSHLAIGAMHCGKSAREAVMTACNYDHNSAPPVHQLVLGKPRNGSHRK
jgi:hypothetical protein